MPKDGDVEWRWPTGGPVIGLPVVDDRTVYFVSLDNVLRALNKSSGVQRWKSPLPLRPTTGPLHAAESLVVSGPAPTLRAYKAQDGKSAGEFALPGELAAPPHLFTPVVGSFPVVIAVTRDIVEGRDRRRADALVRAGDRAVHPAAEPDPDEPDGVTAGPAGAVAAAAHCGHRCFDEAEAGVAASGAARHPAVERQVRAGRRQADVLEGQPAQDERDQLQRDHREADERHERDQSDARPRQRRDERRADDQRRG